MRSNRRAYHREQQTLHPAPCRLHQRHPPRLHRQHLGPAQRSIVPPIHGFLLFRLVLELLPPVPVLHSAVMGLEAQGPAQASARVRATRQAPRLASVLPGDLHQTPRSPSSAHQPKVDHLLGLDSLVAIHWPHSAALTSLGYRLLVLAAEMRLPDRVPAPWHSRRLQLPEPAAA